MMGLPGIGHEAQALADSLYQELSFAGGAEAASITPSQAQVYWAFQASRLEQEQSTWQEQDLRKGMGDEAQLSAASTQEAAGPALPATDKEVPKTDPAESAAIQHSPKMQLQKQPGLHREDESQGGLLRAAFGEGQAGGNARGFRGKLGEQVRAAMREGRSVEAPPPDQAPADSAADTAVQDPPKPSDALLGPALQRKQQLRPQLAAAVVAVNNQVWPEETIESSMQAGALRCDTTLLEGLQEGAASSADSPGSSRGSAPIAPDRRAKSGASDPGGGAARWDVTALMEDSGPAGAVPSAGGRAREDAAAMFGIGGVWGMQELGVTEEVTFVAAKEESIIPAPQAPNASSVAAAAAAAPAGKAVGSVELLVAATKEAAKDGPGALEVAAEEDLGAAPDLAAAAEGDEAVAAAAFAQSVWEQAVAAVEACPLAEWEDPGTVAEAAAVVGEEPAVVGALLQGRAWADPSTLQLGAGWGAGLMTDRPGDQETYAAPLVAPLEFEEPIVLGGSVKRGAKVLIKSGSAAPARKAWAPGEVVPAVKAPVSAPAASRQPLSGRKKATSHAWASFIGLAKALILAADAFGIWWCMNTVAEYERLASPAMLCPS